MRRLIGASLGLVLLTSATNISSVQLGNWRVRWNEQQARVSGPGHTLTLYQPPEKCTSGPDNDTLDGAVAAFAPPYASIYTRYKSLCGASHEINLDFATFNIQTGKPVGLLDLFQQNDVFKALVSDSYVKRTLGTQKPKTLDSLFDALSGGKPTCAHLGRDNLTNFALYAVRGRQVNIRLGLPWSRGGDLNCPFGFDQLSLWLPASDKLLAALQPAQARGYLMQGLKQRRSLLETLDLLPANQIGRP